MTVKEYESLRQEILVNQQIIAQYNTLLYTVTVAVLAFAFDKENPFLCLLPYVAIIPIYLLEEDTKKCMDRTAAYIIVFLETLENTEYHWETRLYNKNIIDHEKHSIPAQKILKLNLQTRVSYLFLALMCSVFSIYKVLFNGSMFAEKLTSILVICIITLCTLSMMIRSANRASQYKRDYIKKWQTYKEIEEAQKRDSNRNPQ